MIINVTEDHIKRGEKCNPCGCPIALAVIEAVGNRFEYISVNTCRIALGNHIALAMEVQLPDFAKQFIDQFDLGKPVQPITLEIDLGEPS